MLKVLVLGDNLRDLNIIEDALFDEAECYFAFDSAKALARYDKALRKKEPYDHIFVDEKLISNSFHSFVEYVRGQEAVKGQDDLSAVPISVIIDRCDNVSQLYSRGCSNYITKPLCKKAIMDRMQAFSQ